VQAEKGISRPGRTQQLGKQTSANTKLIEAANNDLAAKKQAIEAATDELGRTQRANESAANDLRGTQDEIQRTTNTLAGKKRELDSVSAEIQRMIEERAAFKKQKTGPAAQKAKADNNQQGSSDSVGFEDSISRAVPTVSASKTQCCRKAKRKTSSCVKLCQGVGFFYTLCLIVYLYSMHVLYTARHIIDVYVSAYFSCSSMQPCVG